MATRSSIADIILKSAVSAAGTPAFPHHRDRTVAADLMDSLLNFHRSCERRFLSPNHIFANDLLCIQFKHDHSAIWSDRGALGCLMALLLLSGILQRVQDLHHSESCDVWPRRYGKPRHWTMYSVHQAISGAALFNSSAAVDGTHQA